MMTVGVAAARTLSAGTSWCAPHLVFVCAPHLVFVCAQHVVFVCACAYVSVPPSFAPTRHAGEIRQDASRTHTREKMKRSRVNGKPEAVIAEMTFKVMTSFRIESYEANAVIIAEGSCTADVAVVSEGCAALASLGLGFRVQGSGCATLSSLGSGFRV